MNDELEFERKGALEALFEEVQERFGDQHETYKKAESEFHEMLIDLQAVISIGIDNRALLITKDSNTNITAIIDKIEACEFLKLFKEIEGSFVTSSARAAIALWHTTSCALNNLLEIDLKLDSEEVLNSIPVLHVISSVIASYELLCHCASFANFEATIDQDEYNELYMRMQDMMGFNPDEEE